MPYASGTTMARILEQVRFRFETEPKFQAHSQPDALLLDFANEALDEIYQYTSPERDKQTFTTTVDDWDYLIGTDPVGAPIADIMSEILRVDYDGVPLAPLFTEEQVVLPTSDSTSGTPSNWFQIWDGGGRYLCFTAPPDAAETITIWFLKKPDVLTATSSIPKLFNQFWFLFKNYIIMKVFEWLGKYKDTGWYETWRIKPGLRLLNKNKHALLGRKAKRKQYYGAPDLLD